MDGWESRRKRVPGNDWCIIQLATAGKIRGVDIDTNHFLGNHPPHASLDGINTFSSNVRELESADWKEILPISSLEPGSQNLFEILDDKIYTHIRLNIYPDGGVARLKVYGEVFRDWEMVNRDELIDLAAATNGSRPLICNDMFFSHMGNLLMPGRAMNMGDGWETRRNRDPNNRDWVIIRLAHPGTIEKIMVDTCHFKGNYPDSCLVEGCNISDAEEEKINLDPSSVEWKIILPQASLQADLEHFFEKELNDIGPFTHARFTIFPDGGVSRLHLWGRIK